MEELLERGFFVSNMPTSLLEEQAGPLQPNEEQGQIRCLRDCQLLLSVGKGRGPPATSQAAEWTAGLTAGADSAPLLLWGHCDPGPWAETRCGGGPD